MIADTVAVVAGDVDVNFYCLIAAIVVVVGGGCGVFGYSIQLLL